MLAGFKLSAMNVPIDEYATAFILKNHNGHEFKANVMEGKISYLAIRNYRSGYKAEAISSQGLEQNTLSLQAEMNEGKTSLDCSIE